MKIMIVEDDRALNDGIALSFSGDEVIQARCLADANRLYRENSASASGAVDVIILDINMPDGSGLEFCRQIRQKDDVPIIFLTANDMEIDIVSGLESGGDDYITKPFSLAVLRARVNAVMRRKHTRSADVESLKTTEVFEFSDYSFDFENMRFFNGAQQVELSKTEQRLLKIFIKHPGQTLTREILMQRVWPDGPEFVDKNALSVTVKRLRSKLGNIPLRTVYGIGYVWGGSEQK